MGELFLDVHGVGVRLQAASAAVLEELRRDFAYFAADGSGADPIRLSLGLAAPAPLSWGRFSLRWRGWRAYDAGLCRRVEYDEGARAVYDFARRVGRLECSDADRLRELAYLAVLSRAGEALEERGWHRVHALAFEADGEGGLVVLPSGGGKSSLALELLRRTGLGIVAEDTAWIDPELRLRAFPLRWGVRPDADLRGVPPTLVRRFVRRRHGLKLVVDLPFYRARVRDGVPLTRLLIGARAPGPASVEPLRAPAALAALLAPLVVGVGIAQMAEYCLRPGAAARLAQTASARASLAWKIVREVPAGRLRMGGSAVEAAKVLLALGGLAREEQLHLGAELRQVGEPQLAAGGPGHPGGQR